VTKCDVAKKISAFSGRNVRPQRAGLKEFPLRVVGLYTPSFFRHYNSVYINRATGRKLRQYDQQAENQQYGQDWFYFGDLPLMWVRIQPALISTGMRIDRFWRIVARGSVTRGRASARPRSRKGQKTVAGNEDLTLPPPISPTRWLQPRDTYQCSINPSGRMDCPSFSDAIDT
jgi:hypothetical protein